VIAGLLFALAGAVGLAGGIWLIVIAFKVSTFWGFVVWFVPFGGLVFASKHWDQARKPFLLQVGSLIAFVLIGVALAIFSPSKTSAAAAASPAPVVTVERAPSGPGPAKAAEAPPVAIPVLKGGPAELNTVMGRARALANDWQPEAALLRIEASQVVDGLVQTENGGVATVTFGPSQFDVTSVRTGFFVVTYDRRGLRAEPATGLTGLPAKALPEPMCAPEDAYKRAAGGEKPMLALRYALDAQKQPAWLLFEAGDLQKKPRAFEPQSCREIRTGPR